MLQIQGFELISLNVLILIKDFHVLSTFTDSPPLNYVGIHELLAVKLALKE